MPDCNLDGQMDAETTHENDQERSDWNKPLKNFKKQESKNTIEEYSIDKYRSIDEKRREKI